LATSLDLVTASVGTNAAAISSETTARVNADSALAQTATTLAATVAGNTSAISTEATTRADADTALAGTVTALVAVVDGNTAAITNEASVRASAIAAEASTRDALSVQFRGSYEGNDLGALTSGLLYQERIARATQDSALTQQITLLTAGAGEQFDYKTIWYFDAGVEGWTGNGTPVVTAGWIRPANHATDPYMLSPTGVDADGTKYSQVRLRIRKTGTPVWGGYLWWKAIGDTTWDAARRVTLTEPTYDSTIGLITVNPLWAVPIDQIRLDLSDDQSASHYFDIDWIAVGRPSPGASSAQLYEEQTVRAAADASEITARQVLSSKLTGLTDPTGLTLATLASGLIFDEKTLRTSQDAVIASSVTSLTSTVTNNLTTVNASITSEATTRANADTAISGTVTALTTRVTTAEADLITEQNARSNADAAEVTLRQSLSTKLTGSTDHTGVTLTNISSGLLFDEKSARSTADSTEITARQLLSSTLIGSVDPTGKTLGNITSGIVFDERTTRAGETSALSTRASSLEASVNNGTTGLASKASVQYVDTAKSDAISTSAAATQVVQAQLNSGGATFVSISAAQTQANTATTNAATAQTAANTANTAISDIASDNKLVPVEKSAVRAEWDVIAAEKAVLNAQASTFSVTTENTTYNTKFTALADYLNAATWSSGIPSWISDANLSVTTTIVGATFRTKFKEYYDARTSLLNAIAAKAKVLADAAQTQANTATTNAATAQTTANTAVANALAVANRATVLETTVNNGTTGLGTKASITQVATAKSEAIAASAVVTDTISAQLSTSVELFSENWDNSNALSMWELKTGNGELSIASVADSVSGGKVLRVGLNNGTDGAWLVNKKVIAFDPNRLYRTTMRIRRLQGVGTIYVGWHGVASDGVTDVNALGLPSFSSQHYHVANTSNPNVGWTTYVGYTKGFSVGNGSQVIGTLTSPGTMYAGVRYIRPMLLVNYNNAVGQVEIDSYIVEDVTDSAANSAAVQVETTARIAQDAVLAGQITTAQSTLNGSISSVQTTLQTNIDAVDGEVTNIGALYSAKVTVNGLVGAFGIYNTGAEVEAGFDVDKFWIGRTSGDKRKPFIISGGVVYLDNAVINQLTADKIDSRGLSIKDALGNVILAAGNALDWTKIGGAATNLSGLGYSGSLNATTNQTDATTNAAIGVAVTNAATAQTTANTANTAIAAIASDSWLTAGEKPVAKLAYDTIIAEQSGIQAQASAYSVTTELTPYNAAVTALSTYLNTTLGAQWNTIPGTDVAITGATFRTKFQDVYTTKQTLLTKIAQVAGTLATWSTVTGTGKPANNATVGAIIGTNLSGQITAANASTYIANAAIGIAKIDTASIGSLSALSATIGLLRTATSGARLEIASDVIRVYDANNVLRVKIGNLA